MPDLVGRQLGKYQVVERLGRGGMADVYKAYQPGMDRYVAIKVMHPHLAYDDDFVARFQREARSVANLHHPNIVQVFDFDVEDDETYYMVMEYVENGTSLKDMLQDLASEGKRLPLDMTLSIIGKLADALDYAHSEGMVHRDIKPANILLPSTQRPLLSDFGIAKLMGQTGLTASGAMIGTPAYMSPEQGRGETADHRSDIYALGVVFYEMVLGRPPYDADTPYAIILKHINEPLISPRSMDASLPLSVERLCLRALSKDLDARFQSAGEMRAVANEALNELKETTAPGVLTPVVSIPPMGNDDKEAAHTLPVEPQPESTRLASSDGAETTRRLPRALWAVPAALVVIAIVAGAVILSPFGSSEPEPPSEEVVAEASALMDAAWDMLENTGNVSESIELVEEAVDTASSDPATLRRAAEFYIHLADFDAATDVVQTGLAADPQSAALRLLNGELALYGEAYAPETAEAEFQFAIENCGDDREVCARANALLAELYAFQTDDKEAALPLIEQAIELADEPYLKADFMWKKAQIVFDDSSPDEAIALLEEGYLLTDATAVWFLEEASRLALRSNQPERAAEIMQEALAQHPVNAPGWVQLGYAQWRAGDNEAARLAAEEARLNEPTWLDAHYLQGLIELEEGNLEQAAEHFTRLNEDSDAWYEGYSWLLFNPSFGHDLYYDLARLAIAQGDSDQAVGYLEESVGIHGAWPTANLLLGDLYREQGEVDAALEAYYRALDGAWNDEELQREIQQLIAELEG